jgi:hypothetical protein
MSIGRAITTGATTNGLGGLVITLGNNNPQQVILRYNFRRTFENLADAGGIAYVIRIILRGLRR